jgi:hypothetical protein
MIPANELCRLSLAGAASYDITHAPVLAIAPLVFSGNHGTPALLAHLRGLDAGAHTHKPARMCASALMHACTCTHALTYTRLRCDAIGF